MGSSSQEAQEIHIASLEQAGEEWKVVAYSKDLLPAAYQMLS